MGTRVLYDTDTKINLHSDPRGVMGVYAYYIRFTRVTAHGYYRM